MARSTRLETLMFWLMLAAGYAVLAPCLILPAWLEYEAQRAQLHDRDAALADLEAQLVQTQRQIERSQNDPAYILRLAAREFGLGKAGSLAEGVERLSGGSRSPVERFHNDEGARSVPLKHVEPDASLPHVPLPTVEAMNR